MEANSLERLSYRSEILGEEELETLITKGHSLTDILLDKKHLQWNIEVSPTKTSGIHI